MLASGKYLQFLRFMKARSLMTEASVCQKCNVIGSDFRAPNHSTFSMHAHFREFLRICLYSCVFARAAPQSCDSLNLISESIDDIPSSVNKHGDFHIPPVPNTKISIIITDFSIKRKLTESIPWQWQHRWSWTVRRGPCWPDTPVARLLFRPKEWRWKWGWKWGWK